MPVAEVSLPPFQSHNFSVSFSVYQWKTLLLELENLVIEYNPVREANLQQAISELTKVKRLEVSIPPWNEC
jgi:hypothetical protein